MNEPAHTLPTALTEGEVSVLLEFRAFRTEPFHGLFKPFFETAEDRDAVGVELRRLRERLPT